MQCKSALAPVILNSIDKKNIAKQDKPYLQKYPKSYKSAMLTNSSKTVQNISFETM